MLTLFVIFFSGVGSISATVSVDSVEGKNETHLMVNVVPMDIFDCDVIVEDLCYFEEANYRIMEEENPIIIGPLASSYVWELCPKYKLTYNMPESEFFNWKWRNIRNALWFNVFCYLLVVTHNPELTQNLSQISKHF